MVRGEGGRVRAAPAAARARARRQARAAALGERRGGRVRGRRVQRRALPRGYGEERDADGGGAARAPRGRGTADVWGHGAGDVEEGRGKGVVCGLWDHGRQGDSEQCVDFLDLRWVEPAVWVTVGSWGRGRMEDIRKGRLLVIRRAYTLALDSRKSRL